MPTPGEHKTVQARILAYAQEIGWTFVPRSEAERRRGFDPDGATPQDRARNASLFFGDLLYQLMTAQIRVHGLDLRELDAASERGQPCPRVEGEAEVHADKAVRAPGAMLHQ